MSERADRFKRSAEEAERAAENAKNELERSAYQRISDGWRALEGQERERNRRGF